MYMQWLTLFCLLVSTNVVQLEEDLGIGPVFIWHGISECNTFEATTKLEKVFKERGSLVKSVRIGETCFDDTLAAYWSIDDQVKVVCDHLTNDPDLVNGFTAIGLSQGGLMVRALVEKCSTINVTTLITFGAPHGGTFGFPICQFLTSELFKALCTLSDRVKDAFGFGPTSLTPFFSALPEFAYTGYWIDPYRQRSNVELNFLNNLINPTESYKKNLLKLKKFIAIHFDPDLAIYPPGSARFDEYKPGTTDVVIPYNETEHYKKDLVGLRTLDETGRFITILKEGIHMMYEPEWFIENVVNKYLIGQMTR